MTMLFDKPLTVTPHAERLDLLLTARTAVSHHDAAVQDDSNTLLFNRQKQLLPCHRSLKLPTQEQIDRISEEQSCPAEVAELLGLGEVTFPQFVAVALLRTFLDLYNRGEGAGLFEGMERYTRLETRARHAAAVAPTLLLWWSRLTDQLNVPIHGGDADARLLRLLAVPAAVQGYTLEALKGDIRALVALARHWHDQGKLQNADYAEKAGRVAITSAPVVLYFDAARVAAGSDSAQVFEVPAVTGNTVRHQVVRYPSWLHLCRHLDLPAAEPGAGPVPAGVEALFVNGGNIRAGAKQPSNPFALAMRARALYPSLDLLGGVMDSFDLGEGRLKVSAWLVCAENRSALAGTPACDLPAATVSAFDLLDDVTLTRQATAQGVGQMIYNFQTLCAGTELLVRLTLVPQTAARTAGALYCAVREYLDGEALIGGQGARGFGHMRGEWLSETAPWAERGAAYEAYLSGNQEELADGLRAGTVGTDTGILS